MSSLRPLITGTAFILLLVTTAATAAPPAGKGGKPPKDSSPPIVAIDDPTNGSTVTGQFVVAGSASDEGRVTRVEVSTDAGPFVTAAGTDRWAYQVNTDALAPGTHTLIARAFDGAGNAAQTTVTVTVGSPAPTPPLPPPPPPPTDTTPPSVVISRPTPGATVEGIVTATGTASDAGGLASVDVSLDGGPFRAATGTASWTIPLDTTGLSEGTHTLTARATDVAGNRSTVSTTLSIATRALAGSHLVTPEGATIEVAADVANWSAQQVYELLRANAYQLALLGPSLTVKVQTVYASQTASSAAESNGIYSNFRATIYLRANGASTFDFRPDQIMAHEYGHAWANYHLFISQRNVWTKYLQARGLVGDSRLDSTYNWSRGEMIADDYRLLFGSLAAQQQAGYINTAVADPRTVTGLRDWFLNTWTKP